MRRSKPDNRLEQRLREIEAWERTKEGRAVLAAEAARRRERECLAAKYRRRRVA